jgi:hypothetical protein
MITMMVVESGVLLSRGEVMMEVEVWDGDRNGAKRAVLPKRQGRCGA